MQRLSDWGLPMSAFRNFLQSSHVESKALFNLPHRIAARAMGNSLNPAHIEGLKRALKENQDGRVRSMCAWALKRFSGREAEE